MSAIRLFLFAAVSLGVFKADAKSVNDKIYGGDDVRIEDYKYQVFIKGPLGGCGGSIISENFVITAAHCTMKNKPEKFKVCAGQDSKRICESWGGYYMTGVQQIYEHDKFVQEKKWVQHPETGEYGETLVKSDYDVALLQLAKKLSR